MCYTIGLHTRKVVVVVVVKGAISACSGDPWHWKNSQSALRQVVGSLVPEIAPGNENQPRRRFFYFICVATATTKTTKKHLFIFFIIHTTILCNPPTSAVREVVEFYDSIAVTFFYIVTHNMCIDYWCAASSATVNC